MHYVSNIPELECNKQLSDLHTYLSMNYRFVPFNYEKTIILRFQESEYY